MSSGEHTERKDLLTRVLLQFHTREAATLLPVWTAATQAIKTPKLRLAVDEVCATWTAKKAKPQPGDLLAIAERERRPPGAPPASENAGFASDGRLATLGDLEAMARRWLTAKGLPTDECTLRAQMRALLGSGVRLSREAWIAAAREGLVLGIPHRLDAHERAAGRMLRDLGVAGLAWCGLARRFVPFAEARDLDREAEEAGMPYPPRTMTLEAIEAAHRELEAGGAPGAAPRAAPRGAYADAMDDLFGPQG